MDQALTEADTETLHSFTVLLLPPNGHTWDKVSSQRFSVSNATTGNVISKRAPKAPEGATRVSDDVFSL